MPYDDQDVIVCRPNETHWIENRAPGQQYCFGVDGVGAETIPSDVYRLSTELAEVRDMLLRSYTESASSHDARVQLLCGLAIAVMENSLKQPQDLPSKLQLVREKIEEHYAEEWDTTTLAYAVDLSPDYLRHAFKSAYGVSAARHLEATRLTAARRILESTDEPIAEVARLCGYRDAGYFARRFRHEIGIAPTEYRRSAEHEHDSTIRYDNNLYIAHCEREHAEPLMPTRKAPDSRRTTNTRSSDQFVPGTRRSSHAR